MDSVSPAFMRRKDAANYLKAKYGFGAARSLAKLACVGGGPIFCRAGKIPLYTRDELDRWALTKIGAPMRSTADNGRAA